MRDAATLSLFGDAAQAPRPTRMVPTLAPATPARAPQLRPYQVEADAAIDRELSLRRSTLVVMATGTGKTVLFAKQAKKRGGALVLAHRDSLIRQAAAKLRAETGEAVAIEKAERTAFASPYICASVQTLRGERLALFAKRFRELGTIIIDEAHRATAASYRAIVDAFPRAQVIGVTATADRTDGVAMGNVFESVAYRYEMAAAMRDGWLTPIKVVSVYCKASLDGIKVKGTGATRDFDQAQLDDAVDQVAGDNARALLDCCASDRLIVFTPGVKSAHATAGALNELRVGCAAAVDGTMDDYEKDGIGRRHRDGEFQFLVNCGVYTEGYDDERLIGIFDSAPTKSRLRAVQKWGRGTRLWPDGVAHLATADERRAAIAASPKPWAMLYDLTCNSTTHDPVSPADDLLAGRATDDEIKRVKDRLRKGGGDVEATLIEVRAEVEADRRSAAARAAAIASRRRAARGQERTIWDMLGQRAPRTDIPLAPERQATQPQLALLAKWRVPVPLGGLSKGDAGRLIDAVIKRRSAGLASVAQVAFLERRGLQARDLSFERASDLIGAIKATGIVPAGYAEREPGMEG